MGGWVITGGYMRVAEGRDGEVVVYVWVGGRVDG